MIVGTISLVKDFGVFVKLAPNLDGLIHKNNFGALIINDFKKNSNIKVRVLKVDQVLKRISLSVEELDFTPKSDERIESSSKPILINPKVALKQIDLEQ